MWYILNSTPSVILVLVNVLLKTFIPTRQIHRAPQGERSSGEVWNQPPAFIYISFSVPTVEAIYSLREVSQYFLWPPIPKGQISIGLILYHGDAFKEFLVLVSKF